MKARVDARLFGVLALSAAVAGFVLLMPESAHAAASRPPKSLGPALAAVTGLALFFLGLPAIALAIYLAVPRSWVAIGFPVLAVLPFAVFFQWHNAAIASLPGKLLAIVAISLTVGLLSAAGVGLARQLVKEAVRIGAAATATAAIISFAIGVIGPFCGLAVAEAASTAPLGAALSVVFALVTAGLVALAFPLGRLSRSVAGTTIGTGAGFLGLALWPVAISNAADGGQGFLVVFLLVPLIPLVLVLARAGAKVAEHPPALPQTPDRERVE
jgi:hypothetical protein